MDPESRHEPYGTSLMKDGEEPLTSQPRVLDTSAYSDISQRVIPDYGEEEYQSECAWQECGGMQGVGVYLGEWASYEQLVVRKVEPMVPWLLDQLVLFPWPFTTFLFYEAPGVSHPITWPGPFICPWDHVAPSCPCPAHAPTMTWRKLKILTL